MCATVALAAAGFSQTPVLAAQATSLPASLTPPAKLNPRINGPSVFGVRCGSPFLYAIPATGGRPMTFAAEGLPEGLTLDASTGRITGKLSVPGTNAVTLVAKNDKGEARKAFSSSRVRKSP